MTPVAAGVGFSTIPPRPVADIVGMTGSPWQLHHQSGLEHDRAQFVRLSERAGVLTIRLVGPVVGQREAPIIGEHLRKPLERLGRDLRLVVVDLSDVTMLASMGLGTLIDIRNRARKARARSILYGMNGEIERLVRLMRIERLYTIARSREELDRLAA